MKVKFYLSRPDAKGHTAVFASVAYNGHRVKVYTSETIEPKHWNPNTHSARNTPKFREHPEFNTRLDDIKSIINKALLDYKKLHAGAIPDPVKFKEILDIALLRKKPKAETTFQQYFTSFIKRQTDGLRINPKTKEPIKPEAAKHYQHTLNTLIAFATAEDKSLDWQAIDLPFYNDYTEHLTKSGIALNTLGAHIRRLKTVLNEAAAYGHKVNSDYKNPFFSVQNEDADNIYLTEQELAAVVALDLSDNKRLDAVRDSFLICCYTAQRYSDVSGLKPSDISGGFIRIVQQKTGKRVTIPVHPVLEDIILKYGGRLPAPISNEKTNSYLKEIGQKVTALQVKESKQITKGGVKLEISLHRWEMLSTHTGRRTFSTLEYLKGTPPITIMAITGHKTEKSFLLYIRASSDDHAIKMKALWADAARLKLKAV